MEVMGLRKLLFSVSLTLMAAAAMLALVVGEPSPNSEASSHRDAPLITEDPTADNTDVYAFVSTEPGRSDHITLISNFIPLEEPGEGPNYYRFSDNVLYEIKVDTNGDAKPDLTYQFDFSTQIGAITPNTFLYNTGKIGAPPDPGDPSSQYTNLNQPQSYVLTEIGAKNGRGDDDDDDHGGGRRQSQVLLNNARVAPIHIGPSSTGTPEEYEALADAAVHTVGSSPNDIRVFAGPRDEGFYVDLMGNFDLLNIRDPGVDTTSGFNVHTIAIEIPKSRLAAAGDTDGVIGVWSSSSRPKGSVLRDDDDEGERSGKMVQVSRLGNPLVNEVLIPLGFKDKYNATQPKNDAKNIADFIVNPGTSQGAAAFVPLLNSITGCTPTDGRADLDLTLLKGIPAGTLGLPGTQDTQRKDGPVTADVLHLNTNVAPTTGTGSYSPLGAFGGDVAGFPNGRRVGDDVLDIDARAAAGAILHLLGAINCPASLGISDNVQSNDVPYLDHFPYLGLPHQGYNHVHDHGISVFSAASLGMGLLGFILALGVAGPRLIGAARRRVKA
jgi:hypothetical protein